MTTPNRYRRLLALATSSPWALEPQRLVDVMEVLSYLSGGGTMSQAEVAAYVEAAGPRRPRADSAAGGAIAVVGLHGIIAPRAEQVDNISGPGGTSLDRFMGRMRAAVEHRDVGAVVIDIDSPGGNVAGVQEAADELRTMVREGGKPIVAVANHYAASAAYWLGSQASEFIVSPSGTVGSIGVYAAHRDLSEQLAADGERVTLIHAGAHKVEDSPFAPLSDEARAHIQAQVDTYNRTFVEAVARGRGVDEAVVDDRFGQGRTYLSADALSRGMVDRVETFGQVIDRLRADIRPPRRAQAPRSAAEFEFWSPPGG